MGTRDVVHPTPVQAARRFRPDVEGLRALAVVVVILDHVAGWPRGGFLGVDVFFVISGFLITGLMLEEHARTGHVSYRGFVTRRVKRILPAATVVLLVTAVASRLVLLGAQADQALRDVAWSTFFLANWHFSALGTDYFQRDLPPSPVQHYWSLAVEEQFYLVWPWVLTVLLALASRRGGRAVVRLVAAAVAALLALSLGYGFLATADEPTAAYFSTFARGWQLLAGALLAVVVARSPGVPGRLRAPIGWCGLGLILASVLLAGPSASMPVPGSVPVVVGALLVLLAGVGASSFRYAVVLCHPVVRYVGRISFSLYLWHWPVVVLLGTVAGGGGVLFGTVALLLTVTLSLVSFYLVEDPVRRSTWLEPGHERPAGPPSLTGTRLQSAWVVVAVVVALLTGAGAVAQARGGDSPGFQVTQRELTATPASTDPTADPTGDPTGAMTSEPAGPALLDVIQQQLQDSIDAKQFPTLLPGPDDFTALPAGRVNWRQQPCVPAAPSPTCRPGDGSAGDVVLLGDSMSLYWSPAVRKTFEPYGYAVDDRSRSACPMVDLGIESVESEGCGDYRREMLQRIEAERPAVVVVSALYYDVHLLADDEVGTPGEQWTQAARPVLDRLSAAAGRVVVLSAPPESSDPKACITRFATPDDCETRISDEWRTAMAADRRAARGLANVTVVDTSSWVCSTTDDLCPAFVNGMVIRKDFFHVTVAFSEYVAPLLGQAMVAAGVLSSADSS